jgi:adenine phosphoribosyltransferase
MEYFTLNIENITRKLPIISLGPKIKVASFNLLGDRELVEVLAKKLYIKIKNIEFDYLVGPEVKVVPLLQELSRLVGINRYIICRKEIHGYMVKPIKTKKEPHLVLNGADVSLIWGKRVIIVDDVITTGNTISAVEELMQKSKAQVVAEIAVFKQGDRLNPTQKEIIVLGKLPVFNP